MRILTLLSLFVLWLVPCCSQELSTPASAEKQVMKAVPDANRPAGAASRPKIGVALEGGGALGEAHIGVLKWFEEHHIPIDYLAGTSMGGLVGGMYATGKSADELRDLVEKANWDLLLSGGTPYSDLSFRRKQDARAVPNSIVIGLRHGPSLPPGLNSGHQINLLIDRETLDYSNVHSFDDLPIPFRCVSTELVSGKPYVFESGSLSDAMRATMSIPGVFAPVRKDNKIFVDGGLVDNLPTDVVRKMGADIVIAVHLQISPASAKDIQSAFSILGRSVALVIADTEIRGMAGADLIIKADVEKYSTSDYQKTSELIQEGYEATQAKAQLLKPYELDDDAWAEYLSGKRSRQRGTPGVPQFVHVLGTDPVSSKNIEKFMEPFLGQPLDTKAIDKALTRLTGVGRYDSITYSVVNADGRTGLQLRVQEKSYAPPTLLPSVEIDGSEPQDVNFTMGVRITAMDVWGYRSEWRNDLQFGATYGIRSELYRPFTAFSKWFFSPYIDAAQTNLKIYQKSDPRAIWRVDNVEGGIDLGYAINHFSEIRAGYGIGYQDYSLRLGTPEFGSADGRVGAFHMQYTLDHTNEPVIPTKGYFAQTYFRWYDTTPLSTTAYPSLEQVLQYFQPVSRSGSIFLIGEGGSTFGRSSFATPAYFLGGVGRLSAYGLNELVGNQYFLGRTGYLHKIFQLPPFVGKQVYLTGYGEIGKMYGDPFPTPKLSADGSVGLLAETAFGPVLIGASVGDTGHHKWFFQLGRVF